MTARLFVLFICLPCQLSLAADWDAIAKAPPEIAVLQMKVKPLVVCADKDGWARIPDMLSQRGAVIYMPDDGHLGVADIQVISDGYLFITCNWDYQGNQSGDWDKDAWDERKFKSKGWDKLTKGGKRHGNAHGIGLGEGRVGQQGCPTLWTTNSRF